MIADSGTGTANLGTLALHDLVRAGKIRYLGVSNFSGWQLMKSLALADKHHHPRYVAHQVYYSLVGRDYEWELMSLGLDQGVGAVVWSPLGWGRLTGKVRRGQPPRDERQLRQNLGAVGWRLSDEQIARLDAVSAKTAPYPYFPYYRQEGFARLNPPAA